MFDAIPPFKMKLNTLVFFEKAKKSKGNDDKQDQQPKTKKNLENKREKKESVIALIRRAIVIIPMILKLFRLALLWLWTLRIDKKKTKATTCLQEKERVIFLQDYL